MTTDGRSAEYDAQAIALAVEFIEKVQEFARLNNRINGEPGPMEKRAAVLLTMLQPLASRLEREAAK